MIKTNHLQAIHELNMSYLVMAQSMLKEDRESAMFRLGIDADVADVILHLQAKDLIQFASSSGCLIKLRMSAKEMATVSSSSSRQMSASMILGSQDPASILN